MADRFCASLLALAAELSASGDAPKQAHGMRLHQAVMMGILNAVPEAGWDVVVFPGFPSLPKLARFSAPPLAKHWSCLIDRVSNAIDPKAPDKMLGIALKCATELISPRDRMGYFIRLFGGELRYAKEMTGSLLAGSDASPEVRGARAVSALSARQESALPPFTTRHPALISKVLTCLGHDNAKVRAKCAEIIRRVLDSFPGYTRQLFTELVAQLDQNADNSHLLTGGSHSLIGFFGTPISERFFDLACDVAAWACRSPPTDANEEIVRAFRCVISQAFDATNFSDPRFAGDAWVAQAVAFIHRLSERVAQYAGDGRLRAFATSLAISLAEGNPRVLSIELFDLLLNSLLSDDVSVHQSSMNALYTVFELLIVRVPRRQRVPVAVVTAENYDQARWVDRICPGISVTEVAFLSAEDLMSEEVQNRYFANGRDRAALCRMLYEQFVATDEIVSKLCDLIVSQQVLHEEAYCKSRVQFWSSLIRLFGPEFGLKVIGLIEHLTESHSMMALHVIAGEMLSGLFLSLKGWPYAAISQLFPRLLPFLRRILMESECDFQTVWFMSIVCGIADRDPRRFFWLFEHLISCLPQAIAQLREIKSASLIVDIVLEYSWRVPELLPRILREGVMPWFANSTDWSEQVRDCAIRAISSVFTCFFRMNDASVPRELAELFENTLMKAGDEFIVSWLLAQFTAQAISSVLLNRLAIGCVRQWVDLPLDKNEEEEKRARHALLHLVRSNWVWACAARPITQENARPILQQVLEHLMPLNRVWQIQTVLILLIESFICVNFLFFSDADLEKAVWDIAMPALMNANSDIQDAGTELLAFLLLTSPHLRTLIPQLGADFRKALFSGATAPLALKLSGVKGLSAIIHSTVLFDSVPDYVLDAFQALGEAQQMDSALELSISVTFADFWSVHEESLLPDVAETLMPYREAVRTSYFC
jgi:hypothetical protein